MKLPHGNELKRWNFHENVNLEMQWKFCTCIVPPLKTPKMIADLKEKKSLKILPLINYIQTHNIHMQKKKILKRHWASGGNIWTTLVLPLLNRIGMYIARLLVFTFLSEASPIIELYILYSNRTYLRHFRPFVVSFCAILAVLPNKAQYMKYRKTVITF